MEGQLRPQQQPSGLLRTKQATESVCKQDFASGCGSTYNRCSSSTAGQRPQPRSATRHLIQNLMCPRRSERGLLGTSARQAKEASPAFLSLESALQPPMQGGERASPECTTKSRMACYSAAGFGGLASLQGLLQSKVLGKQRYFTQESVE
eukprot:5895978-Amphidinium_carterae.4